MADLLTDEEQADQIKQWIRKNGLSIVLIIVVGIGSVVGFNYFQGYQADNREIASNLYADFLEARGLDEPVEGIVQNLRDDHASSTYLVYTLMYLAKDAVEADDYTLAVELFSEAWEATSNDSLKDMITTRKARVEAANEDYDAALATIANLKTEGYTSTALEIQGDIYVGKGNLSEARASYVSARDAMNEDLNKEAINVKIAAIPEGD